MQIISDRITRRNSPLLHYEFERIVRVTTFGNVFRVVINAPLVSFNEREDIRGSLQGYVYSQTNQSWGLLLDYPMEGMWETACLTELKDMNDVQASFDDDFKVLYEQLLKIAGTRPDINVSAMIEEV